MAARNWREDAYLEDVQIQIPGHRSLRSYISAGFRSPSAGNEVALVLLLLDGTTRVELLQDSSPPSSEDGIAASDWELDTQEALAAAVSDEGRRYLEENPETQCSFMQLARSSRFPGHSVVWRLAIVPCPFGDPVQDTTIDAMTGEVLSNDS
jgi:hypothetical protein